MQFQQPNNMDVPPQQQQQQQQQSYQQYQQFQQFQQSMQMQQKGPSMQVKYSICKYRRM